jgi:hydrogenase nickel incorporation protein HypB
MAKNDEIARALRERFAALGVLALNLISAPGSGKTALLEQTMKRLSGRTRVGVLTGDIATDNDARRLSRYGKARQIGTGGACHLDAAMVEKHLAGFPLDDLGILFIENVGNLVCPTGFDLGETAKVVVVSVPEGDDKPLKYPGIFSRARLMVLNKIDLLPHVPFDRETALANARKVNPRIDTIETSCVTGEGLDSWLAWLDAQTGRRP